MCAGTDFICHVIVLGIGHHLRIVCSATAVCWAFCAFQTKQPVRRNCDIVCQYNVWVQLLVVGAQVLLYWSFGVYAFVLLVIYIFMSTLKLTDNLSVSSTVITVLLQVSRLRFEYQADLFIFQ